jgi:hypothetical protein
MPCPLSRLLVQFSEALRPSTHAHVMSDPLYPLELFFSMDQKKLKLIQKIQTENL